MTVQQGMDSTRIREISDQLDAEVHKLGDVLATGSASAGVLEGNWGGDDGQALLVRWRSDALRQLTSASEMLRSTSAQLQRQADQQDDASGESRTGAGGAPVGPVGPGGPGRPGGAGRTAGEDPAPGTISVSSTDRDEHSVGVRTTTDSDGNTHRYDPVTGKSWVEGEDGTWSQEEDRQGHRTRTDIDGTEHDDGRTSTHESSRGDGGGRRSYGEKWETEWTDEGREKSDRSVLDQVQTEPLVTQDLWDQSAHAEVWGDEWGDDALGASAEVLSANAETSGEAGISLEDGAYVQANAEAGAYLARGEAHWQNEYGTSAEGEAYVGAEASAEGLASLGPGGAQIDAGLEAFAGGSAEARLSQEIGDYGSVGVGGEVSYGIGAHADLEGEISADRVGFSLDVGATLGVGGGATFDVSVSPSDIIGDLSDAGGAVADSQLNPMNWGW
ncbi:hypothetical protein [Janibacter sp. GS2]|uniref:hypothetical protein n=1 Tax=Janibacter sp. GS2 TaxID=3442646 RepID=UPI003EBFA4F3